MLPQDLSHEPPWRGPAEQTGLNRARSQLSPDWAQIPSDWMMIAYDWIDTQMAEYHSSITAVSQQYREVAGRSSTGQGRAGHAGQGKGARGKQRAEER
eukprot:COSAG01_NODE_6304_length_3745_cov_13.685957_4_plen_97_part_01